MNESTVASRPNRAVSFLTVLVIGSALGISVGIWGLTTAVALGALAAGILLFVIFLGSPQVLLALLLVGYYPFFWVTSLLGITQTSNLTAGWLLFAFLNLSITIIRNRRSLAFDLPNISFAILVGLAILTFGYKSLLGELPSNLAQFYWMFPLMLGPYFAGQALTEGQLEGFVKWVLFLCAVFTMLLVYYVFQGKGFGTTGRLTPFGGLFNPITAAYIVAFGILSLLPATINRGKGQDWLLFTAWLLVGLPLVVLTGARQVLVVLPITGILAIFADLVRKNRSRLRTSVLIAICVAITAVVVASASMLGRVSSVALDRMVAFAADPFAEGISRLDRWDAELGLVEDTWLLGAGFGGSYQVTDDSGAHNMFIEALADYGVIGLLLLVAITFVAVRRTLLILGNARSQWWRRSIALLFVFSLVGSMVSGRLTGVVNLWVTCGLVLGLPMRSTVARGVGE